MHIALCHELGSWAFLKQHNSVKINRSNQSTKYQSSIKSTKQQSNNAWLIKDQRINRNINLSSTIHTHMISTIRSTIHY